MNINENNSNIYSLWSNRTAYHVTPQRKGYITHDKYISWSGGIADSLLYYTHNCRVKFFSFPPFAWPFPPFLSYHQALGGCARGVSRMETCKDDLCRWPGMCFKAVDAYALKQNLRCLRSIHHIRRSKQLALNTSALMKLNNKLNDNNLILSIC